MSHPIVNALETIRASFRENSASRADIRDVQAVQRNRRAGQLLADSCPNELHAGLDLQPRLLLLSFVCVFLSVTSYLAALLFFSPSITVFLFPPVTDGASCAV